MKQAELPLDQFLKTFGESPIPLDGRGARSAWRYNKTLQTVVDIALANLPPDASHLLEIPAFLDADARHDDILVADHRDPSLEFFRPVETSPSTKYFEMACNLRNRFGVKREQGTISKFIKLLKAEEVQSLEGAFRKAFLVLCSAESFSRSFADSSAPSESMEYPSASSAPYTGPRKCCAYDYAKSDCRIRQVTSDANINI